MPKSPGPERLPTNDQQHHEFRRVAHEHGSITNRRYRNEGNVKLDLSQLIEALGYGPVENEYTILGGSIDIYIPHPPRHHRNQGARARKRSSLGPVCSTAPTRTRTPRGILKKILDAFLTKPQDRALFDLPPRPKDA